MTSPAPLPEDLQRWVTQHLTPVTAVTDVSGPRDNSRVWRVASPTRAAYLKISPSPDDHTREVRAYHLAARTFSPHETPRLLAADPALHTILTTPVPGHVVKDANLPPEPETRAHELAGRLLQRWHAQMSPVADESARAAAISSVTARTAEAAAQLGHCAHLLAEPQRALLAQACQQLPSLAATLPLAFRHGDFSPRNWLWDDHEHGLALLDFEKADTGIAAEDLVWIFAAVWPHRPDLRTAFLTGFGRPLDDTETRALRYFTALAALSYLHAGVTHHEPALLSRAHDALGQLTTART